MKPSSIIKQNEVKFNYSIVRDDDLPERLKKIMKTIHSLSDKTFKNVWNDTIEQLDRISQQITGDDALSIMISYICNFSALWINEMFRIALYDSDAGRTREEIIFIVTDGIRRVFEK